MWIIYAFPPFRLIQTTLRKIEDYKSEGLVVVPHCGPMWYPQMLKLLTNKPVLLPKGKHVLRLGHADAFHPLYRKLQLLGMWLSGRPWKHKAFMEGLVTSSAPPGETRPKNSTQRTSQGGHVSVLGGMVIDFNHL